jgi:hypothetical protein
MPETEDPIALVAPQRVDKQIREQTIERLRAAAADRSSIDGRLQAVEAEWDAERALEVAASAIVVGGSLLALARHPRWAVLPVVAAGFLVQHAVQGWCPPWAALRALGLRTRREIEHERHALKALRHDYAGATARWVDAAALLRVVEGPR